MPKRQKTFRITKKPLCFGDLFTVCGYENPNFPPENNYSFNSLKPYAFSQIDDYLGIQNNGDVYVYLIPIVKGTEAYNHPGPYDSLKLTLERADDLFSTEDFDRLVSELGNCFNLFETDTPQKTVKQKSFKTRSSGPVPQSLFMEEVEVIDGFSPEVMDTIYIDDITIDVEKWVFGKDIKLLDSDDDQDGWTTAFRLRVDEIDIILNQRDSTFYSNDEYEDFDEVKRRGIPCPFPIISGMDSEYLGEFTFSGNEKGYLFCNKFNGQPNYLIHEME